MAASYHCTPGYKLGSRNARYAFETVNCQTVSAGDSGDTSTTEVDIGVVGTEHKSYSTLPFVRTSALPS